MQRAAGVKLRWQHSAIIPFDVVDLPASIGKICECFNASYIFCGLSVFETGKGEFHRRRSWAWGPCLARPAYVANETMAGRASSCMHIGVVVRNYILSISGGVGYGCSDLRKEDCKMRGELYMALDARITLSGRMGELDGRSS